MKAERQFEDELEIFRKECEAASQFFYSELAVHEVAKHNKCVFDYLNRNPLFWCTVVAALQKSAVIALHRIFSSGRHNVDSLLHIAEANLSIFSKEALGLRKQGNNQQPPDWLAEYLQRAYQPTTKDFHRIRSQVEKYKKIYVDKYKDLRDKVFAHNVASNSAEIQILVAKTNIREMERLVVFLLKLYEALSELFFNGRRPVFRPLRYSARRMRVSPSPPSHGRGVHERITKETQEVLLKACAPLQHQSPDDMRPEYRFDYSKSRPNRFAATFGTGKVAVVLEADVASVFRTSEAVNRLLRSLIAALPEKAGSGEVRRRKKAG